jgi:hypothetical protein
MKPPHVLLRLAMAFVAGLGTALLATLAAAILELYLTGHGHGSIMREIVNWPAAGIHLSAAGLAMFAAAFTAAWLAWRLTGRTARNAGQ